MKYKLSIILFLSILTSFAQGEANIWYFGQNAGLDFSSGSPVALTNGQLNTEEGCATISDSSGSLLFYTDGITVYNKNHTIMVNGTGLLGHTSSTQSATIVPKPGSSNLYYIFTTDNEHDPDGFRYSVVDMNLDGGNGAITSNKNVLVYTPTIESLGITKHANGIDYWIITHEWDNNNFKAFLLTSSGLNLTPVTTSIGLAVTGSAPTDFSAAGMIRVSPSGLKLAFTSVSDFAQLFTFNNSTGILTNELTLLTEAGELMGAAFSQDESLLYISNPNTGAIYQFNLNATDIPNSKISIHNSDIPGQMQMGSDGKIYIAFGSKYYLGIIHDPNVLGTGCNFELNGIYLAGRKSKLGLPSFNQSFFYTPTIQFQNACVNEMVSFSQNNSSVTGAIWNFGDSTTSTSLAPSHTYTSAGTYTVTVTTTSPSGTGTATRDIVISAVPTATQPIDLKVCDTNNDGFYSFDLTQNDMAILNGQSTTQFGIRYFSGATAITTPTAYNNTTTYTTETITAEVYNKENGNCTASTTFAIQVFESPQPSTTLLPIEKCDDTSFGTDTDGKVVFDLTQNETAILNGQSATTFTVAYYNDNTFTNLIVSPTNYVNTTTTETIYVKVYNTQNPNCMAPTSFQLEVFSLPVVNHPVTLKQCDDDNDGFSSFNLNEAIELISSDSSLRSYGFYEDFACLSPITNLTNYSNQTVSNDTVYVRVENTNGCYRVVTLNLVVSTTLISSSIQEHYYVCDDMVSGSNTDGIATFDFSSANSTIVAQYPPGQLLDITYYSNLADALAEQNAIADISNYTNTGYPTTQNIYVRVDSQTNNECLGLGHHITLHVEPLPIVQPLDYRHCDDDQDGIYGFDTSALETDLLNGLTNVSVSYFDSSGNNVTMTNPFATGTQTLTAVVTNTYGQNCSYSTIVTFTVDDLPEVFAIPDTLTKVCDDETIPSEQDGSYPFDTSTFESILLGSQTGMTVNYYDESGNALSSPLPNPFETTSQTITVEVVNPNNTTCIATETITFEVYPIPDISLNGTELVCSNNPNFTKVINAGLIDESQINLFTYIWNFNGTLITGETQYELSVNTEGTYTVAVTNSDGCVITRTIEVTASEIATITEIEITELTDENSILVFVSGNGDYEYSLDNETYQVSNVFYNVTPGIYTVYARDLYGCGTASDEVAVLGAPKYFTPNGDGYNDTWNIAGANADFNSDTIIYIFDRYGKLLKQITPLGSGWDGTFNGQLMPSSDYWYSLQLENGKTVKGHFTLKR